MRRDCGRFPISGQLIGAARKSLNSCNLPLIVVVGPTGAGKSELAIRLAKVIGGEIVNCDSIQVYRQLCIGAAKTPLAERRGVVHHLLDVVRLDEQLTAGEYARMGREVIAAVLHRQAVPIVTGGTGFYLKALLEGLSPAPARDERLRERLREAIEHNPAILWRYLRRYDREAAQRIHRNDLPKQMRAVEIGMLSRRPASQVQAGARAAMHGVDVLKIGLMPERCLLRKRLEARSRWMFANGLLDEVRAILDSGVPPRAKALQSIGYKQALAVLAGSLTIEDAIADTQIRTNQYAKRQMTWFRADSNIRWIYGFGTDASALECAETWVRDFLVAGPSAKQFPVVPIL